MAKSPVLVEAVARELSKEPVSVKLALRRLREEKLVDVKGKGRGGKDMTAQDAALLCLATMSGETIKDSPDAVREFWTLLPVSFPTMGKGPMLTLTPGRPLVRSEFIDRLVLNRLTMLEPFGTHLAAAFDAAATGTLFPAKEDFDTRQEDFAPGQGEADRWITVRIYGPRKAASIYYGINRQWSFRRHFGEPVDFEQFSMSYDPQRAEGRAGYIEMRQMGDKTILAIAEALR